MTHTNSRSELDTGLNSVRTILLDMSEIVADRVDEVTAALLERDVARADTLIAEDDELDLMSSNAEQLCIEILLREHPVAGDLRAIVAALHMNSDIERSGDLTTNIAKAIGWLQGTRTDDEIRALILQMAAQATFLFHKAAEAYRELDGAKAAAIKQLDDVLDELHRTYIGTVIAKSRQGDLHPQQTLQLALIGRFYERIGDHAENMGERIRYIIDGWTPEQAGAERARRQVDGSHVATPSRGLAVIDRVAEERRIDATRRAFVANVSHELKTPVAAIALLAEALVGMDAAQTHATPNDNGRVEIVGQIGREVARVEALIDDLLELARLEEPTAADPATHTAVHIDDVALQATDIVSGLADASGVRIVVTGLPCAISVRGEHRQLVRALVNLLDNAIKYSGKGAEVRLAVNRMGPNVDVAVADEGVGIPRPELERIFERFYRVDPARSRQTGGTGLGLSIVRHVVENHGGQVMVDSKYGEGSTFVLQLPIEEVNELPDGDADDDKEDDR